MEKVFVFSVATSKNCFSCFKNCESCVALGGIFFPWCRKRKPFLFNAFGRIWLLLFSAGKGNSWCINFVKKEAKECTKEGGTEITPRARCALETNLIAYKRVFVFAVATWRNSQHVQHASTPTTSGVKVQARDSVLSSSVVCHFFLFCLLQFNADGTGYCTDSGAHCNSKTDVVAIEYVLNCDFMNIQSCVSSLKEWLSF